MVLKGTAADEFRRSAVSRPSGRRKQAARSKIPVFALGEFIGKTVRVEQSSCKGEQGIEGRVLDETANTLVLETSRGRKTVPKKGSVFLFVEEGERIPGSIVLCRPEERTKRLAKTYGMR